MAPRYKVILSKDERLELEAVSSKRKRAAGKLLYDACALLLDAGEHRPNWYAGKVMETLGTTIQSLERLNKGFFEEGLSPTIERKERLTPQRKFKFSGELEAQLIALACSEASDYRRQFDFTGAPPHNGSVSCN